VDLRDWCPYCHDYVDTSQISSQYGNIDGSVIEIIEYYCTRCCNLIFTEERPVDNKGDLNGSDNI